MVTEQKDMRIPTELIPKCPVCGKSMTMNLRSAHRFVEDTGWHRAAERYTQFLQSHKNEPVLFLELGVGYNAPGIVKFSFWQMTMQNPNAVYACVNLDKADVPQEIAGRSICIQGDIGEMIKVL